MPDPTDPTATPIPNIGDTDKLKQATEYVKAHTSALGAWAEETFNVSTAMEKLQGFVDDQQIKLNDLTALTGQQATQFGLFAAGALGASKSFDKLNTSIDSDRLGSFSQDMAGLIGTVGKLGDNFSATKGPGKMLVDMLGSMGAGGKDVAEAVSLGGTAVANLAKNMMMGADNTLRLETALMQASVQGGNFNELYTGIGETFKGVGDHLDRLNGMYAQFANVLGNTMEATGKGREEIARYATSLLQIPNGLEAVFKNTTILRQETNVLTAAMQYADGAGRDTKQVFDDVAHAVVEYGMKGDDALKFTARMTDMSADLHAPISIVHDALLKTADAFKQYEMDGVDATKMSQGLADAVKGYSQSLEAVGVPASRAIQLSSQYTKQMADMTIAQEAFVSLQTGGPGGLMGGFQFEKMMKDNPEQAGQKMQEALKKMMGGHLVSLDEASKSEAAASQYTKQRQIMGSGMLGVKADSKGDQDAMIAAIMKGKVPSSATSAEKTLADTIDKGKEIEQLSRTAIKEANITAEVVQLQTGKFQLDTLQNATAARSGSGVSGIDGQGKGVAVDNRQRLRDAQMKGMDLKRPEANMPVANMAQHIARLTDIVSAAKDAATSVGAQATGNNNTSINVPGQSIMELPAGPASPAITEAYKKKMQAQHMSDQKKTGFASSPWATLDDYSPAGEQVGKAIPSGKSDQTKSDIVGGKSGATSQASSNAPVPVMFADGSTLNINLTSTCPHCGNKTQTSEQAKANNASV